MDSALLEYFESYYDDPSHGPKTAEAILNRLVNRALISLWAHNDDVLIVLFKEVCQMPPSKQWWYATVEYKAVADVAFEKKLLVLAAKHGGHFAQSDSYVPGPARHVIYQFELETEAITFRDAVKSAFLSDRELFLGVHSDTESYTPRLR